MPSSQGFCFFPPKGLLGKRQKCHKLSSRVSICLHPFFAGCHWIRLWQVLWSVVWTVWAVTPYVAGKLALNSEAVCRDAVRLGHWLQHTEMSQRVFWWMLSEEKEASPAGLKQDCSPTGQFLYLSSLSGETELSHWCTALEWECNIPCQAAGLTLSLSSASPTCWNNRADPVPLTNSHRSSLSQWPVRDPHTPRMDNSNHISS